MDIINYTYKNKIKIALCLYGHVGIKSCASTRRENDITEESSIAETDPTITFQNILNSLLSRYDTDVFIHSWTINQAELLKKLYNPRKGLFEKQIDFTTDISEYGIIDEEISKWKISDDAKIGYELLLPSRGSVSEIKKEMVRMAYRSKSRWYSTQKAIQLKAEYEKQLNFQYDFVLVSRLDILFRTPLDFNNLSPENFYASFRHGRPDYNLALFDFCFLSGTKIMDEFGKLYDHIQDYCIRPTFSCREHVKKYIGDEKIKDFSFRAEKIL